MINPLELLIPNTDNQQRKADSFIWGTVTSVAPLRVRVDGEADPLLGSPDSLVSVVTLGVGTRVFMVSAGRRLTIVGSAAAKEPSVPTGTVLMWSTDTVPDGYLICRGGTQLIVSYPDLAAVLGTIYGGNGTTTFGIPDWRGRAPVGLNPGDSDFGILNHPTGAKTHTLTAAEMPSHRHASPGTYNVGPGAGATAMVVNTVATPGNSNLTGGGDPHNNVQPSRTVNFIIKT